MGGSGLGQLSCVLNGGGLSAPSMARDYDINYSTNLPHLGCIGLAFPHCASFVQNVLVQKSAFAGLRSKYLGRVSDNFSQIF